MSEPDNWIFEKLKEEQNIDNSSLLNYEFKYEYIEEFKRIIFTKYFCIYS